MTNTLEKEIINLNNTIETLASAILTLSAKINSIELDLKLEKQKRSEIVQTIQNVGDATQKAIYSASPECQKRISRRKKIAGRNRSAGGRRKKSSK